MLQSKSLSGPSKVGILRKGMDTQTYNCWVLTNLIDTEFRRVDSIKIALLLDSDRGPGGVVQRWAAVDNLARHIEPVRRVYLGNGLVRRNVESKCEC